MKKILLITLTLFVFAAIQAQDPVTWGFAAKKIAAKTYELQITGTIQTPWSIYSQRTPAGGLLPTTISFAKNPLVYLAGTVKEQGTLKKKFDEVFAVDVLYYKEKVSFVQRIKLKKNVKTSISGKLDYMACNEEQCLPPTEIPFFIALQ